MRRSKFTEEQIAYGLRLAEGGTPVVDVCAHISRIAAGRTAS